MLSSIQRIRSSRISVIGAGGIGSLAAMTLAGAGVCELTLVDPDRVELSNLNRQFFFRRGDVGRHKVDVLKEAVADRYPEILVHNARESVDKANAHRFVEGRDAVIVTADEPLGVSSLVFAKAQAPGVDAIACGYSGRNAGVKLSVRGCSGPIEDSPIQWRRIAQSVMPSFGPTNVELASAASALVLARLSGSPGVTGGFDSTWDTLTFPRQWR